MAKQNKTLPESIKGVIQQYGNEIVNDLPAAKPVLRTLLKAG